MEYLPKNPHRGYEINVVGMGEAICWEFICLAAHVYSVLHFSVSLPMDQRVNLHCTVCSVSIFLLQKWKRQQG